MVTKAIACDLCGLPAWHPLVTDSGETFCCPSCLEVSQLLRQAEDVNEGSLGGDELGEGRGETAVFALGGMWCPSCAWLIRERLNRTPGVAQADVSFLQREARITYDPRKRNETLADRGLDFEDALQVFAGPNFEVQDLRKAYGEIRMICFGMLADRMVVVGYTPRGADRHVFSMRKANDREQARIAPLLGL